MKENNDNRQMWRYCFGDNLFFKYDGQIDANPIHFWYVINSFLGLKSIQRNKFP